MKPITNIRDKSPFPLRAGSIVIAQPFWSDAAHKHAVVFIVDHNMHGTRGIILNKASNIRVYELMGYRDIKITKRIYYGGPESLEMISYLHNIPSIPDADYLGN